MHIHIVPVHKQYIKDFSILQAFHNSSMIKDRKIRAIRFFQMKMNIVIFIAAVDLCPDAGLDLLQFIFTDQMVKALFGALKELIYIFVSSHMKELVVCVKEFIIIFVRFVYDKRTRKVI